MLTQILIFMHSLRAQPIELSPPPIAGKRTFGQTKDRESGKDKKQQHVFNIFNDVGRIEARTFRLLAATPPDGDVFVTSLKRLLDRELSWLEWKKIRKCLEVSFLRFSPFKSAASLHTPFP